MNEVATRNAHTVSMEDQRRLTVTGIRAVNSIFEKEIEVALDGTRLIIKGNKMSASKLIIEEGIIIVTGDKISSLSYTNQKSGLSLKNLFK